MRTAKKTWKLLIIIHQYPVVEMASNEESVSVSSMTILRNWMPFGIKTLSDKNENFHLKYKAFFSYTLSCEYRVVINKYSRLLFTSEDRLWANLRVPRARTIDEYDVTMPVSYIRRTSEINCSDVRKGCPRRYQW